MDGARGNSMAQFFGKLRAAIDRRQSTASYDDRSLGYSSLGAQQMSGAASYSGLDSRSSSALSGLGLYSTHTAGTSSGNIRGEKSYWREPEYRSLTQRTDLSYSRDRLEEPRYSSYDRDTAYSRDGAYSLDSRALRSPAEIDPPISSTSARLGRVLEAVGVRDETALRNLLSSAVQNRAGARVGAEDDLYDAAYGGRGYDRDRRDARPGSREKQSRSGSDRTRTKSRDGGRSRSPRYSSREQPDRRDREGRRTRPVSSTRSSGSAGRAERRHSAGGSSRSAAKSSKAEVDMLSMEELQVVQQVSEQFGINNMSLALEALKFVKQLGNTSADELKLFGRLVRGLNEGRLSLSQVASRLPRHLAEVVVSGNIKPALLQMIVDSAAAPRRTPSRERRDREEKRPRKEDASPPRSRKTGTEAAAKPSKSSKEKEPVKVKVKNFPGVPSDMEVETLFENIAVADIRKAKTNMITSFAYVDLANPDDLDKALKLDGTEFKGSKLVVEKAVPKTTTKKDDSTSPVPEKSIGVKVKMLSSDTSDEELERLFQEENNIAVADIRIQKNCSVIVELAKAADLDKALKLDGSEFKGSKLEVEKVVPAQLPKKKKVTPPEPERRIVVKKLPLGTSDEDVKDLLKTKYISHVASLRIEKNKNNKHDMWAHVELADSKAFRSAMKLDGFMFKRRKLQVVKYAPTRGKVVSTPPKKSIEKELARRKSEKTGTEAAAKSSRSKHSEEPSRSKVYDIVVKRLPLGTSAEEVKSLLKKTSDISVKEMIIVKNKNNKKNMWAHVDLANSKDLNRALKLDGSEFKGRTLEVVKGAPSKGKDVSTPPEDSTIVAGHNSRKLHVRDLPLSCTEWDVMAAFPRALGVQIPSSRGKDSKYRMAFVQLSSEEEVEEAVRKQGIKIKGHKVVLNYSEPKVAGATSPGGGSQLKAGEVKSSVLIVKGLQADITEADLKKAFPDSSEARRPTGKTCGFVEFPTIQAAEASYEKMSGKTIQGHEVKIEFAEPLRGTKAMLMMKSSILKVKNLPDDTTEESLQAVFEECIAVRLVMVSRGETGKQLAFGFVEFSSPEAAQEAYETNSDLTVGGQKVTLEFALPRGESTGTEGAWQPRAAQSNSGSARRKIAIPRRPTQGVLGGRVHSRRTVDFARAAVRRAHDRVGLGRGQSRPAITGSALQAALRRVIGIQAAGRSIYSKHRVSERVVERRDIKRKVGVAPQRTRSVRTRLTRS